MNTTLKRMNPRDLKLLELNARYMKHEQFMRLVENVKRDGKLTSVPFACLTEDGKYLVLSGNHRVKAAIAAGLEEIDVMVTDEPLTEQQRIAIQLSHNAIVGQDDYAILKVLYDKVTDIDLKLYSGLDDKTLELVEKAATASLSEANLIFQTATIVFLPNELERAKAVLDEAMKMANGDVVLLARYSDYDRWLDAVEAAGSAHGVKNAATAIMVLLDVFEKNIGDLSAGWEHDETNKNWVPLASVFGTTKIPAEAARIMKKAIDRMIGAGEITNKNRWQMLEYLAADYLAGEGNGWTPTTLQ